MGKLDPLYERLGVQPLCGGECFVFFICFTHYRASRHCYAYLSMLHMLIYIIRASVVITAMRCGSMYLCVRV